MRRIVYIILTLLFVGHLAAFSSEYKELNNIKAPSDIKHMSIARMNVLAKDIRDAIINKVNITGGHLGPDLGIVEATIAMHYVFNSPTDKLIFDVSHQTYPHKMLTGRKDAFINPSEHPEITGYSNPKESPHDFFILGHTSTSISLASGMAKARDLKGESYNIVALIGDGSLTGGEALEGLNNAATLGSNFIIIVNDNEMSIAENQGGIYKNLKLLRDTNGMAVNNIFKTMGYDYYYVPKGNNIRALIATFEKVKDTTKPTIVHIHTLKGKGYFPAEQDKEKYHYQSAGFLNPQDDTAIAPPETYNTYTANYLIEAKKSNPAVVAITPATPGATGFTKEFRTRMGKNYVDVGIAEQHAVGFASGIATNGGKPVLAVCSSFIQRAYDQLSQDVAINNSPVVILVTGYGINGADVTHLGIFDIPLISNIPNIVYMAPTNKEEYTAILNWAISQNKYPVAIRMPQGTVKSSGITDTTNYSNINKYKLDKKGSDIAIIALGDFFELGTALHKEIKAKLNIEPTLINPIFISGVDYDLLEQLKKDHKIVITLENGVLDGGFGEKITRFYGDSDMKVLNYGAKKDFTDRVSKEELFKKYHLTKELILEDIIELKESLQKNNLEKDRSEGTF